LATNKPTPRVHVSVYFTNSQAQIFVLDPKLDKLEEKPKELVIRRGDATKGVIRIHREHVCYYVVAKHIEEAASKSKHPAFDPSADDTIQFR
jgi:hypothetical protein